MKRRSAVAGFALLAPWLGACEHLTAAGAREVYMKGQPTSISQAELQQDIERFTGHFVDRLAQAMDPLMDTNEVQQKVAALRRTLLYLANCFDIATGKLPEINMLDMLVFVTLSRDAFERHWLLADFGGRGVPMLRALEASEREVWELSGKVLTAEQAEDLRQLIRTWREQNPTQFRVETVRLFEFSEMAGKAAQAQTAHGLLASVRSATKAADEALLLGERALFLAHRAPFMLRLQVRLGALEVLSDGMAQLEGSDALLDRSEAVLDRVQALQPMVQDTREILRSAEALVREARQLSESLKPLVASMEPMLKARVQADGTTTTGMEELVARGDRLSDSSLQTLRELRALLPEAPEAWAAVGDRVDASVQRLMGYAALVGVSWAMAFWGGYYVVKRTLLRRKLPPGE